MGKKQEKKGKKLKSFAMTMEMMGGIIVLFIAASFATGGPAITLKTVLGTISISTVIAAWMFGILGITLIVLSVIEAYKLDKEGG